MLFAIVIIISLAGAAAGGPPSGRAPTQEPSTPHGKPVDYSGWTAQTGGSEASGDVSENSKGTPVQQQITEKNLVEFKATITWTDEPDQYPRHQNQPDELGVEIVAPWGENKSASGKNAYSASGGSGTVTVTFSVTQYKYNGVNGTGTWNVTPFAKDCGDHMPKNVGLIKWLDTGNTYNLKIEWKYYVKGKGG